MAFRYNRLFLSVAVASAIASVAAEAAEERAIEEIVVWGEESRSRAGAAHPSSLLTQDDMLSINVATTEDLVKYEPSLVIRRRFIGDSNGTLGMRGSNMFQTSRSMVFADGVPLHYLLQSRWNGAPRWTMVSASEIAQVEVLYGPFSAEYSGNSMGGVVLIESAIPQEREFHFDSSFFSQEFDAYGFDDTVSGYKTFMSYGDRLGDTSVYLSYNRLENESQPQTFYFGSGASTAGATQVSGLLAGNDFRGNERLWFGDTGIVDTVTDNYKLKVGHEFGEWEALLNMAYEDRLTDSGSPNAYVRDSQGLPVYGGRVVQDGQAINIPSSRLNVSELQRDSLSLGLRLRGPITDGISFEGNINDFRVLRDETRSSLVHPDHPGWTPEGQVSDFGDTGWQSAEARLIFRNPGTSGLELVTGARFERYELNRDVFSSPDYRSGVFGEFTSRSGGETSIAALFAQVNWQISASWDLGLGLRGESFQSDNGYYSSNDPATPEFDLVDVPDTDASELSPKFSLAYQPVQDWRFAYAFGQAYRFPIVEELFSQFSAYNAVSFANPELKPEAGLHHNFTIERAVAGGVVRVNLFQETIDDVIEAQSESLPGGLSVRTFIPLDQVETRGVEFITDINNLWFDRLDVRFNVAYTDSEIVENEPDPSIEGNVYPRMPEWRGNLLATYHINSRWNAGVNLQYASDSFGRSSNIDREDGVYGAQDGYTRLGLKSTYHFDNGLALGLGVDNISNEIAYVAHPWPGRTVYANLSYDF